MYKMNNKQRNELSNQIAIFSLVTIFTGIAFLVYCFTTY